MHLKTLTLVGFKSFADRTRIECEPGVTVVVGPNGSGKSNLVDAIAWAMGTQATTTLRTSKMEDVIFAGTAVRSALGRAEVSLTFDNSARRLDLDVADVTVTRRLYRDGTSEYEINGATCRLLDIQELLADSGVGRHQHVLVGQGRVDAVLNANPEEHRAVIEEAAGVVKHRARRDRSIRRLEATDVDLERLRDLLAEIQRRMKPLRRQANAAARHEQVRADWRATRLWVGGERLREVRLRLERLGAVESETRRGLDSALAEREAIVASLGSLQEAAGETGDALERDTAAAARLETSSERLQRIALVARERRLALEQAVTGLDARRRDLVSERADLLERVTATRTEEASAVEAAERAESAFRSLEEEERSLADADRLPAEGAAASLRGDLAALEAAAVRDEREDAEISRRRAAVAAIVDEEGSDAERLTMERSGFVSDQARLAASHERSQAAAEKDRKLASEAEDAHRAAETVLAAARARLEALETAGAGLADPETRTRAESLAGIVGPIAARLDVPGRLAKAVATALGPWSDAFVARDAAGLVAATAEFKSDGLGGVAFVAGGGDGGVPARQAAAAVGGQALVDALGPGADKVLAGTLLGDVVLVEGWSQGRSIVDAHPGVRVVTPEGDLVTSVGIVAAHPDGSGPAAIEAARVDVERAETESARASSRRTTALRARHTSTAREEEAAAALEATQRRIAAIDETLALLERSRAEHQAEIDRLDARSRAIAEAAAGRTERIIAMRRRLADLDGDEPRRQAAWDDIARRREELAARRDEARKRREEAAAVVAAAIERRSLLESRLAEIDAALGDEAPETGSGRVDVLAAIEEHARRARAAVRRHITTIRERQKALRTEAGEAGARLEESRERREQLTGIIEEARERLSGVGVETAELRVRQESIAEALRRDVDASEDEALAAPRPEIPDGVDPSDHADSLSATLRRLGPINQLAAAEYEELKERSEFMEGQLADLEESRSELRKVIKALDDEIGRLFSQAFDDIAAKFAENFTVLFPGGTGRLELTEPDDLLETGVEIHAQPMGKKVGRLTLLSGGERSLAALAFLFAVFRSRPSPFYVLDEVEAALDDANLRRFIRLVDTLRDTSQLVIVTHQQPTMEAADILYGVTMEPGESSRVLAKRLSRTVG
ncbi:MAG TPA: chromosome segregation protein SMC [Acidimicrobiia bacterium]|nr:chromosome segregation protein SMC [Acidimicrobiia bacterium]